MITIIAEAGVNHNGDLETAFRLVDAAVQSGADIVKFQTFKASNLVTSQAEKAAYQKQTTDSSETQLSMLKNLQLTQDMHKELIKYCSSKGIEFLSTAFDEASVDLLRHLGQRKWKIPSGEITNLSYLRLIGSFDQEVILSTGMSNLNEVEHALTILTESGSRLSNITVLHCTTEYPAPLEEVNLLAMTTIRDTFNVAVGYSDHTRGPEISIAAASLGASVVEKHITLDRSMPGPDHRASLEPDEFYEMVRAIRNVEKALGDGVKRPSKSEIKNIEAARKSIVASADIQTGDIFTPSNICVKRPGTGISPMHWDDVIGTHSTRDYSVDDLIQW